MKKNIMLSGTLFLICLAGCAPQLAQTGLSPKEQTWKNFLQKNYPSWEAPVTAPPALYKDFREHKDVAGKKADIAYAPIGKGAAVNNVSSPAVSSSAVAAPAPQMAADEVIFDNDVEFDVTEEVAAPPAAAPVVAEATVLDEKNEVVAPNGDNNIGNFEVYKVEKGDNLGKIALKFYKKSSAWKRIQNANNDVLKGSTVVVPGMKLIIPMP